jgi:predicted RNase H-like HicB family nuclease
LRQFIALIFREADGSFVMKFPDLLGCVAWAETYSACPKVAARALTVHLEEMEQDGYAIPRPSSLERVTTDPRNLGGVPIFVWAAIPAPQAKAAATPFRTATREARC